MMPWQDRFWAKVDRRGPDECWPWLGKLGTTGYGHFTVSYRGHPAHRLAYELVNGPVPDTLVMDHLCRNRGCCNPAHLEPVTNRENILRGVGLPAVHFAKTHCPRGHEYTPENTRWSRGGTTRNCRTCAQRAVRGYGTSAAERLLPKGWELRVSCMAGGPWFAMAGDGPWAVETQDDTLDGALRKLSELLALRSQESQKPPEDRVAEVFGKPDLADRQVWLATSEPPETER
jgi:HNH endonuclease